MRLPLDLLGPLQDRLRSDGVWGVGHAEARWNAYSEASTAWKEYCYLCSGTELRKFVYGKGLTASQKKWQRLSFLESKDKHEKESAASEDLDNYKMRARHRLELEELREWVSQLPPTKTSPSPLKEAETKAPREVSDLQKRRDNLVKSESSPTIPSRLPRQTPPSNAPVQQATYSKWVCSSCENTWEKYYLKEPLWQPSQVNPMPQPKYCPSCYSSSISVVPPAPSSNMTPFWTVVTIILVALFLYWFFTGESGCSVYTAPEDCLGLTG